MHRIGLEKQQPIALLMFQAYSGVETRKQAELLSYQPDIVSKSNRGWTWQYVGFISAVQGNKTAISASTKLINMS